MTMVNEVVGLAVTTFSIQDVVPFTNVTIGSDKVEESCKRLLFPII